MPELDIETKQIVKKQGWDAYKAGRPGEAPYGSGDPRQALWLEGWAKAERDRVSCAEQL